MWNYRNVQVETQIGSIFSRAMTSLNLTNTREILSAIQLAIVSLRIQIDELFLYIDYQCLRHTGLDIGEYNTFDMISKANFRKI